jgi:hypothetical protein
MASDFTYFSEAFWIGLVGGGFAFTGLVVRYCYKSKCKDFELGCLKIKRDIQAETAEDLHAMQNGATHEEEAA